MYYHQGGLFNRNHKNLEAGQSALHTCHLECIGIHLSTFLLLFPPCNSTDKVYLALPFDINNTNFWSKDIFYNSNETKVTITIRPV